MNDPVLQLRRVSRHYGDRTAVSEASFALRAGRIACLLGPSGCGKSTLLRLIAGLEPVDEGAIEIGGVLASSPGISIEPEGRGVGLVFQDCALFPHLSVADNVAFGLTGMARARQRELVAGLLGRFHVDGLARAWPHTLSGGEQQRVAIARALAREPAILLLDEPFSGLDGQLRAQVRLSVLTDLRAMGASVLIVTHDPEEALQIADDMILMSGGRILQTGSPEECYRKPVSPEAARLLGDTVVLPATISDGTAHTLLGDVPAAGFTNGLASVLVRPESLRLDDAGVRATVVSRGFAGPFHTAEFEIEGSRVSARLTQAAPAVGTNVGVSLDPALASVFAGDPA